MKKEHNSCAVLEKCIKALDGISYRDWIKLRTAVDRKFNQQKGEFEKALKLAETEVILELIHSQFGQT